MLISIIRSGVDNKKHFSTTLIKDAVKTNPLKEGGLILIVYPITRLSFWRGNYVKQYQLTIIGNQRMIIIGDGSAYHLKITIHYLLCLFYIRMTPI